MKKFIYKYPLKVVDSQELLLPIGYEILTIQNQNDVPCLWALIDPNEDEKEEV